MKKRTTTKILLLSIVATLAISCKLENGKLPKDVATTCEISDTEFATWFKDSTITENGIVTPANSVDFIHNNNCDFYKWSERMFLWMTSKKDKNKTVFESSEFYTVSPKVDGHRNLIPHKERSIA